MEKMWCTIQNTRYIRTLFTYNHVTEIINVPVCHRAVKGRITKWICLTFQF